MEIHKKTENYLQSLIPNRKVRIEKMENYAKEHHVPIMEPTGMQMLLQILEIHRPKKVLEIGTAIGYSAIRMADHIENVTIVTMERDVERAKIAEENILSSNLKDRINVVLGDAIDIRDNVLQYAPYDVLFIDAAKGQYERFFELYEPLVSIGGLIISDNVLFKGMVSGEVEPTHKRIGTMVKKLRNFNAIRMHDDRFSSMIYPVGDGVMVSVKKSADEVKVK